ncbi:arylsulfatase [Bacteroidota bacterium]
MGKSKLISITGIGTTTLLGLVSCNSGEKQMKNISENLPNIIFIMADDMGYGDLSCLNDNSKILTRNMDRIANEGIIFSDAHTPSAVSTPTRYGVLTGRYSFRTRLKSGVLVGHSKSLIEPGRETVASLLKKSDYITACIGKWHLGLDWQKIDSDKKLFEGNDWDISNTSNVDYNAVIHGGPTDHGFDYSYIIPASLDIAPYCYISNKKIVSPISGHTPDYRKERGVWWRHGDISAGFKHEEVMDMITDQAVGFINSCSEKEKEKPFFLYFPLTAPHTPWLPTNDVNGTSEAGVYGDFVMKVDQTVGRILKALDDNKISENTLIIVTSDNGSDWTREDIEMWNHRANYLYRGRKSDVWEGGHRTPFVARWPKVISAGSKSDQVICLTDLFATCLAITGREVNNNSGEDSFNILPEFISQNNKENIHPSIIHHSISGMFSIRKGKWKFIDGKGSGGWSSNGENELSPGQLYDMENDFEEKNNLYDKYPEIVNELKKELELIKS